MRSNAVLFFFLIGCFIVCSRAKKNEKKKVTYFPLLQRPISSESFMLSDNSKYISDYSLSKECYVL